MIKHLVFGVHLPVIGFNGNNNDKKEGKENLHSREQILSIARKAESLGYDSLSVNDHIVYRTSWFDSLSALTAVAAVTSRIKLGTSVLNIVVRSPVICAKSLSAIDILSSGRLFAAGVGPGSHKGDYDVCGIPFEQRWSRFNEALEILHMLWNNRDREDDDNNNMKSPTPTCIDYNGKYYQLEKISIEPRPFQKPHPPIFIGTWGSSEEGLRRAAKYGDGWMASAYNITPDKFKEKWKTLLNLLLFGSTDDCLEKIRALSEAGVKRIHFWPVSDYLEQIEIFRNEIIPSC